MCDCIHEMNRKLKEQFPESNTQLLYNLFGPPMAVIGTCKADDKVRKKPVIVMAKYCPFCGGLYDKAA